MKSVMYHYVRPETNRPPNYYHLDIDDFRNQLDYFEEEFGFVTKDEFLSVVRGEYESDNLPSGVILTFDDGFRDHYESVYPELQKRGLWGIFYIPIGPYKTGQLLDVHRIHTLLGEVPGGELLSHTRDIVTKEMIPQEKRDKFSDETYKDHNDAIATKETKRILNLYISDKYKSEIIDELIQRLGCSSPSISDFYMTREEINEMYANGMLVGGHTVTHPVLSNLSPEDQRTEISETFSYLDEIIPNLSELTFCYPHGTPATYNKKTVSILNDLNCDWCFTTESGDITINDIINQPQTLPRYDCNEFPNGEISGSIGCQE